MIVVYYPYKDDKNMPSKPYMKYYEDKGLISISGYAKSKTDTQYSLYTISIENCVPVFKFIDDTKHHVCIFYVKYMVGQDMKHVTARISCMHSVIYVYEPVAVRIGIRSMALGKFKMSVFKPLYLATAIVKSSHHIVFKNEEIKTDQVFNETYCKETLDLIKRDYPDFNTIPLANEQQPNRAFFISKQLEWNAIPPLITDEYIKRINSFITQNKIRLPISFLK